MKRKAFATGAVAIAAIALIGVHRPGGGPNDAAQAKPATPVARAEAPHAAPSARPPVAARADRTASEAGLAPAVRVASSARYADAFRKTSNYRAFIEQAMADPLGGGRLYAMLAYFKCMQLSNVRVETSVDDPPPVAAAKLQLADEVARCEGVMQQYGWDVTFLRQLADPRQGVDPLLPAGQRGVLKQSTAATADFDWEQAKATGDGFAVALSLVWNINFLAPKWLGSDFDAERMQTYYAAAGVVGCELRQDCDSAFLNAGRCALAGDCRFTDYRDFVRSTFKPEEQAHYVLALQRIQQAVARR